MRIILSVILFLSLSMVSSAQQQDLGVAAPGSTGGNYGTVHFYDPATLGQKKPELIKYSDIDGSPFWDDQWGNAYLFLSNGGAVKAPKVKLNMYTGDVHYINNMGLELIAESGSVKKVVFLKGMDTTKVISVFECFPDIVEDKKTGYYKVLNTGNIKLLLFQKSFIRTSPYDPTSGKSDTRFFFKTYYAIERDGNFFPLKGINHSELASILNFDNYAEEWLKSKKNRLKNESEAIAFLNYLNSLKK